ncbi:GNAT family N-acetyltransferase [Streptacidiphilus neutrinimicus]|uniref:GNAT family N-acetyltransferase n=1 Tax=Streptacidiphilus neutrinimicus TaxID=105420 RepID=UPI0005A67158|nr:GNAT family N-acetyltransferase [Streptacidiphilus neutrinimicus]
MSTVPETAPLSRAEWEQALRQDAQALPTQTPGWLEAICAQGEWVEAGRRYRWDDGTRIVLPLVRRTGPPEAGLSQPGPTEPGPTEPGPPEPGQHGLGEGAFRRTGFEQAESGRTGTGRTARAQSAFDQSAFDQSAFDQSTFGQAAFGQTDFASWPAEWGVGGPLCPDGPPTPAQTAAVLADLARLPGGVRLRVGPLTARPWAAAVPSRSPCTPRTTHVVDLTGPDGSWRQRLQPAARRSMRKAARSGLDVTRGRTRGDLEVFYALYQESMERWAAQSGEPTDRVRHRIESRDPLHRLVTVAERLGEACSVWTAWYRGEPAASVILLRQGPQQKYWRGAMSRPLAAPTRANHLLHELALQEAADAGCTHYHMGDSHPGGVARFKESLGARPHPTPAYVLPSAGGAVR